MCRYGVLSFVSLEKKYFLLQFPLKCKTTAAIFKMSTYFSTQRQNSWFLASQTNTSVMLLVCLLSVHHRGMCFYWHSLNGSKILSRHQVHVWQCNLVSLGTAIALRLALIVMKHHITYGTLQISYTLLNILTPWSLFLFYRLLLQEEFFVLFFNYRGIIKFSYRILIILAPAIQK